MKKKFFLTCGFTVLCGVAVIVVATDRLHSISPIQAQTMRTHALAFVQADNDEPIAFIGHGGFFDQNGKQIPLTLDFIAKAQDWYRKKLLSTLPAAKRSEFAQFEKRVNTTLMLDAQPRQGQLVMQQYALDWLIANSPEKNRDHRTVGKLKALKSALRWQLPENANDKNFRPGREFKLRQDLEKRLRGADLFIDQRRLLLATINTGQAYIDECAREGVPIPPPIGRLDPAGLTGWKTQGFISQNQQFIVGTPAEVRTFQSVSPAGLCIALPRYTDSSLTTVALDGVICLGQTSSKVCFWDNQMSGSGFDFPAGTQIPIGLPDLSINPAGLYQAGGFELFGGSGGVCTDCHAGQNPYNIHPDTDLNPSGGGPLMGDLNQPPLSLPTFSTVRYDPIVAAGWPQNALSLSPPYVPSACSGCHRAGGSGGAFPHLSTDLPGYCGVLRSALGVLPLPGAGGPPNPLPTMPLGNPGGLRCTPNLAPSDPRFVSCTAAMTASCSPPGMASTDPLLIRCTPEISTLVSWCGVSPTSGPSDRGDPHLTTTNGIDYDFQAAGEFTALRNSSTRFELQTRQSPVSVTFIPGANPYTGLASCVSLNTAVALRVGKHRVTYQPAGKLLTSETLQLRVDGQLVTLTGAGIDLGSGNLLTIADPNGGLDFRISDGTHVIITPNFWSDQGYWYLNIEVLNTPAREGTMGHIFAGNWLPLAPNGSSLGPAPATLDDRHILLNQKFADLWRVTKTNSLFDYEPGSSTDDFTNRAWPPKPGESCKLPGPKPPAEPMKSELARQICSVIKDKVALENCVFDAIVTGDAGVVKAYLRTLQLRQNAIGP